VTVLVASPITRSTAGGSGTPSVAFLKKLVLTMASASGSGSSMGGAASVAASSPVRHTGLMPRRSHAWIDRLTSVHSLPTPAHVTTAPWAPIIEASLAVWLAMSCFSVWVVHSVRRAMTPKKFQSRPWRRYRSRNSGLLATVHDMANAVRYGPVSAPSMISLGCTSHGGVSWVRPYVVVPKAVGRPDLAWGEGAHRR